eukprot:1694722-Pleurochrysis_carterae.AAC.1
MSTRAVTCARARACMCMCPCDRAVWTRTGALSAHPSQQRLAPPPCRRRCDARTPCSASASAVHARVPQIADAAAVSASWSSILPVAIA